MRKKIAIFAIASMLMMPILGLADAVTTNTDLTQVNIEIFKMESMLTALQNQVAELKTNMTSFINNNDLKLATHVSAETDPMKMSSPTILVIGILVSAYFIFKGMDLSYQKVRKVLDKRQHKEEM